MLPAIPILSRSIADTYHTHIHIDAHMHACTCTHTNAQTVKTFFLKDIFQADMNLNWYR